MTEQTAEMTKPKRVPVEVKTIEMTDGRKVDFAGKKKMLKDGIKNEDGSLAIRVDFVNGQTRTYPLNPALVSDFALHGAEQKYGDYLAGAKGDNGEPLDVDDMVIELDELHEQLFTAGLWSQRKEASGVSGVSILFRALVEATGKTTEQIRTFLSAKTAAEKIALRNSERLRPIIARLEAEKVAKTANVDTGALFGELDAA